MHKAGLLTLIACALLNGPVSAADEVMTDSAAYPIIEIKTESTTVASIDLQPVCCLDEVNTSTETRRHIVSYLSASAAYDYVFSSIVDDLRTPFEKGERIEVHSSVPVELRYSFSFTNPKVRHYFPGGYQGIGFGVLNIGAGEKSGLSKAKKYIGNPLVVYIFQGAPFHKMNNGLSLEYEWNFGASIGWKPFAPYNEKFNLTSGSRVNAYLGLGLILRRQFNPYTSLFAAIAISHYSNGNTSWPNPGINTMGLRIGFQWTLNPLKEEFEPPLPETLPRKRLEYDIMFWGASRKRVYRGEGDPILLPGHFGCAGISFSPMVRFGRWWKIGGSADLQWDGSTDKRRNYIEGNSTQNIKFRKASFARQLGVGIAAHAELQMPVFALNVGCGFKFISPPENRGFYQNIALKTYIGDHFFLNIGYQLRNFYQQNNLMLGLGITV